MKKLLLLFTLCLFLQGANAQYKLVKAPKSSNSGNNVQIKSTNIPDETFPAGYCNPTLDKANGIGTDKVSEFATAIQMPKSMFLGTHIYAIRIAIMAEATDLNVFISKDLSKEPVYTQPATIQRVGNWNYIILDTPYLITDGDTYIGYKLKSGGYVLGLDVAKTPNVKADWINLNNGKWESLSTSSRGTIVGNWFIEAILTGGDYSLKKQYNMGMTSLACESYVKVNQEFDLGGSLCNYGVKTIKSFDITSKVGDQTQTKTISGVSIPYGMVYDIEPLKQKIVSEGEYKAEISIANLNGNEDQVSEDNAMSQNVLCYTNYYDRNILVEQYTGQDCGYCPDGEAALKNALKSSEGRYAWVAHHTYGRDKFTIDESLKYATFFGTEGVAPSCAIDRTANEFVETGVIFHPGYTTEQMVAEYLKIPTFVSISLEGTTFDNETKTISVKVSGDFLKESTDLKLNLFLTEDGFIARQSGASNDYVHNHAMRAVLTELYGDAITVENGKYTKTYTYAIPTIINQLQCNPYNMTLVAFVANYNKSNNKACFVHNTTSVALKDLGALSSINNVEKQNVAVYSENGMVHVDGEFNEISVYSMTGSLVKQLTTEGSFSLDNGMYIIKVMNGKKSFVQKVAVNK